MSETYDKRCPVKQGPPGPGAYNVGSIFGYAPKISLSGRPECVKRISKGKPDTSPDPCSYKVASTFGKAHAYSLRSRHVVKSTKNDTPGPGNYYVGSPVHYVHGKSFGLRVDMPGTKQAVPGPGQYMLPQLFGKDTRASTLAGRTAAGEPDSCSVSPAKYNVEKAFGVGSPQYTLKGRVNYSKAKDEVPGVGAYQVGRSVATGSITLKGRVYKEVVFD